jgi:pimeloyl-ACP methyl ester carboxylesterase
MMAATAEEFLVDNSANIPDADADAMRRTIDEKLALARHGLAHGLDGWVDDVMGVVLPWGFDVADITVPTVIWHGADDLAVPVSHGQWLATHIPDARTHIIADAGHASVTEAAPVIIRAALEPLGSSTR